MEWPWQRFRPARLGRRWIAAGALLALAFGGGLWLAFAPGAFTVTTATTCSSGSAVPNPTANPSLVADCEQLLALRGALSGGSMGQREGSQALNWSADMAMTSWTGVTVGGRPQRVTKLHLADSGLTGHVSGLVGDLTGLIELRLNRNRLVGRLPSKLGQLTHLIHAYIAGNGFTGCVPPSLRRVTNNDIASMRLADCPEPTDLSYVYPPMPLTAGTYMYSYKLGTPPLIFDVPEGASVTFHGARLAEVGATASGRFGNVGLTLSTPDGSVIGLDVIFGGEWLRHITSAGVQGESGASTRTSTSAVSDLFDEIVESTWHGSSE